MWIESEDLLHSQIILTVIPPSPLHYVDLPLKSVYAHPACPIIDHLTLCRYFANSQSPRPRHKLHFDNGLVSGDSFPAGLTGYHMYKITNTVFIRIGAPGMETKFLGVPCIEILKDQYLC